MRVALGDVPVLLKLLPSTITPTHFFTGLAYLDAGIECAADGAVTISGSFVAAGPWTLEPPDTLLLSREGREREREPSPV